jgi:hypothetical protein
VDQSRVDNIPGNAQLAVFANVLARVPLPVGQCRSVERSHSVWKGGRCAGTSGEKDQRGLACLRLLALLPVVVPANPFAISSPGIAPPGPVPRLRGAARSLMDGAYAAIRRSRDQLAPRSRRTTCGNSHCALESQPNLHAESSGLPMGKKALAASKAAGEHGELSKLVGTWQGTSRVWFEPGKLGEEARIEGSIRAVLDGRFVLHEYHSQLMGQPQHGIAIIGYHLDEQRYESAWIDSGHMGTAIMFATSEGVASGVGLLGHYGDGAGGPSWGWRTQIELKSPDRLLITAYNISPAGEEAKATEIAYRRRE